MPKTNNLMNPYNIARLVTSLLVVSYVLGVLPFFAKEVEELLSNSSILFAVLLSVLTIGYFDYASSFILVFALVITYLHMKYRVKNPVYNTLYGVQRGTGDVLKGVGSGSRTAITGLGEGASYLVNSVGDGADELVSGFQKGTQHLTTGLGSGTRHLLKGADRIVSGVEGGAHNVISGVGGGAREVIKGAQNVVSGVENSVYHVVDGIGNSAKEIIDGVQLGSVNTLKGLEYGTNSVIKGIDSGAQNMLNLENMENQACEIVGYNKPVQCSGEKSDPSCLCSCSGNTTFKAEGMCQPGVKGYNIGCQLKGGNF